MRFADRADRDLLGNLFQELLGESERPAGANREVHFALEDERDYLAAELWVSTTKDGATIQPELMNALARGAGALPLAAGLVPVADDLVAYLTNVEPETTMGAFRWELASRCVQAALEVDDATIADMTESLSRQLPSIWARDSLQVINRPGILAPMLHHQNELVREAAAKTLGEMANVNEKALDVLLEALKSTVEAGWAAAIGIARLRTPSEASREGLISALGKDYPDPVRWTAAWAIGVMGDGDDGAIRALAVALLDHQTRVHNEAGVALGRLAAKQAEAVDNVLIPRLHDHDYVVRAAAARAVQRLGSPSPVLTNHLLDLIEHPICYGRHPAERDGIDSALAEAIRAVGKTGTSDERTRRLVLDRLEHRDHRVQAAAATAVRRLNISDTRGITTLIKLLRHDMVEVYVAAAGALSALIGNNCHLLDQVSELLHNSEWSIQEAAARSLAQRGAHNMRAGQRLLELTNHKGWRVRQAVAAALAATSAPVLPPEVVDSGLRRLMIDPDGRVRAASVSAAGNRAVPPKTLLSDILCSLCDDARGVRIESARVLSRLGIDDPRIVITLLHALEIPDKEIQKEASESLGRLAKRDAAVFRRILEAREGKTSPRMLDGLRHAIVTASR